jgi:hypothetical protein
VRLIYLEEGDRVVAVAKLAEPDDGEDEPQGSLPGALAPESESNVQSPKSKVKEPGAPDFLDEE